MPVPGAANGDAIFVDVGLFEQETPALDEHAGELGVRSLGLDLRAGDDMGLFGKTQLLEDIDGECGVAQLGELSRLGLNVLAHTPLGMDQI